MRHMSSVNPRTKIDPKRKPLIAVLQRMPEESWGWFVLWAQGNMVQYPDGLGGFKPESRASIERLRAEAEKYVE